jgi:hypothetical protein
MTIEQHEHLVLELAQEQVRVDASFSVEPEAWSGLSVLEIDGLVGDHVIEELEPIAPSDAEDPCVRRIEEDCALAERGVFHIEVAEGLDNSGDAILWTIRDKGSFVRGMDIVHWGLIQHGNNDRDSSGAMQPTRLVDATESSGLRYESFRIAGIE